MNQHLPTIGEAKTLAKRLRAKLADQGVKVSHSAALERIAQQNGFRDWNTFHAATGNLPSQSWESGGRVAGRYLSRPFQATIKSIDMVRPGWFHLTLDLDQAVDVVDSENFSNLRKRISGIVGPKGHTQERTSDGEPHLILDM